VKVFFLTAPLGRPEPPVYPLGAASLIPSLRRHEVAGYDCNLPDHTLDEGLRRARDFGADAVALTFRNVDTTQERDPYTYYPAFRDAAARAREALPGALLVVGGAAFTMHAREIMAEVAAVDVGVAGEGEATLPELLACRGAYRKVRGVWYRDGGTPVATAPREPVDFAALPAPDRHVFAVGGYAAAPFAVGVQTRRGCAFGCIYCTYPGLEGRRVRARGVDDVVAELEGLRLAGVETFSFVDAVWAVPAPAAKQLCREIIRRRLGMKWKAYFDERTFDEELADLALEAGAAEFTFSPDAADDGVLARLGKATRAADLDRTLAVVKPRPRAVVSYSFFINPPGQTARSFGAVIRFYLRGKRRLGRRFLGASFGNIRLEAGTPAYEYAVAAGKVAPAARLLPRTVKELKVLFYHERPLLRWLTRAYVSAWRFKKALARALGRA